MNGRRAVIGLCMLCALVFSAVAAQSAAAAASGTTAYTCVEGSTSTAKFNSATCNETAAGGKFGHTAIAEKTTTELSGIGVGSTTLKGTHAGVKIALETSTIATAPKEFCGEHTAWMENNISGEEMFVTDELCLTYSNVEVVEPVGKKCEVLGIAPSVLKMITTKLLKATTQGQGMFQQFEPASSTVLAEFELINCTVKSLNGVYKVEGSASGVPKGTMTQFSETETTTQGGLTLGSLPAGIGGELELKGRAKGSTGVFTPLGVTTPGEVMS